MSIRYTASQRLVFHIIEACHRSIPAVIPPAVYPAKVSSRGSFEDDWDSLEITVTFPDLINHKGPPVATIAFGLWRQTASALPPAGFLTKFIYTIDGPLTITSRAHQGGDEFYTFVRNAICGDDDFIVPLGTSENRVLMLMEATVNDRQRWLEQTASGAAT